MDKFNSVSKCVLDELKECFERIGYEDVEPLLEAIKNHERIFLLGAGREGLATRAFAMRLMHLGKQSYWIWDDTTPSIGDGDLMICVSGSADIGHENHIANETKKHGATLLLITPSSQGFIYDIADIIVKIPAAAYKAKGDFVETKQLMGNLFEQALFLYFDIIIMILKEELGIHDEEMVARHRNVE